MPKKNRKRTKEEYIHYVTLVTGWEHIYGLGIGGHSRFSDGPYSELSVLKLTGDVVRPDNFKFPKVEIQLSSRAGMLDDDGRELPRSIGLLSSHDDVLAAYVFTPAERMAELLTLAASERLQAVAFTGTKLKWRKGSIINIELMTEFIEEDW